MLYLEHTTDPQGVVIASPTDSIADGFTLRLVGMASGIVYAAVTLTEAAPVMGGQYIAADIGLPADIRQGEYRYEVTDGAEVVTAGVAVVGNSGAEYTVHGEGGIDIKQYGD